MKTRSIKKISNKLSIVVLAAGFLITLSCNKYLDITPKGKQILTTVNDYDAWLNSTKLEGCEPIDLNFFADNFDWPVGQATGLSLPPNYETPKEYFWYEQFNPDVLGTPQIWSTHYQNIYLFNTVIQNVDGAIGDVQKKSSLKAEALLGRAMEYLYLVNEYGKVYNSATSGADLAVPFVTSNDLAAAIPNRSTVQQIYDHILTDLKTAIPNLPADNSGNRFRGSIAAAYSVLARTYLLMGNYTEASANANLALGTPAIAMIDYNDGYTAANYGTPVYKKDAIYNRLSNFRGGTTWVSASMVRAMGANDLRLTKSYYNVGPILAGGSSTAQVPLYYRESEIYSNWGTGEAAARKGTPTDLTIALNELDIVRKCRIDKSAYVRFSSTDKEAVLQAILNERLFEMPFNGTRWFDMRRLDAENRMPVVNRMNGTTVLATLSPKSPRYTLQIPIQVMHFNPDWKQNP